MKIGLLGGSFNPPHDGHLYISSQAKKALKLNQIWWLPNKQNPLKFGKNSDFDHRVQNCQKLTRNFSNILVKDLEKNLKSPYSFDVIVRIVKKYPQHQFFWIIGADNIINFHLWYKWREIMDIIPLIIVNRDQIKKNPTQSKAFLYFQKLQQTSYGPKGRFLRIKKHPMSSTKIRSF